MSGTRGRIIAAVLGVLVVVLLWYQFLYKPASNDVTDAQQQLNQAQSKNDDLQAQVRKLQSGQQGNAQVQAQIAKYEKLIPPTPALDSFLRAAYDIKLKSGVDWVSIAPSPPSPGVGASEIKMQIVVRGGYYQVLDYLNRFEKTTSMPRLVVIDGINMASGGSTSGSTSTGSSSPPTTTGVSSGAPNLSVTLTARMFTQAGTTGAGTGSGGTGSGSGSGVPTTPTTRPTTATSTGAPS